MRSLRRVLTVAAAVVVALSSGALVAHADATPTVYNTPGGQVSQGRLWDTTCQKYSSNVVRCRANIWATTVQFKGGKYVQVTGWTFNNLSYLPSPRASWATNNLGRTNPGWTSEGRTWRTECDTPATGRGGCRSYIWTKQVRSEGGRFVSENAWVFNNVVLFSTAALPPVTEVPKWIIDQSRLEGKGLGPLQVGMPMSTLGKLGYAKYITRNDGCEYWEPSKPLTNRGIDMWPGDDLYALHVDKPGVLTVDGAHVGMTLDEVEAIYGARIVRKELDGYQPVHTAVVRSGGYELIFFNGFGLERPMVGTDTINVIVARKIADELLWEGC